MYSSTQQGTGSPTKFRSNSTYATTFSGPIKKNERMFDVARNENMAQAEFKGSERQWNQQAGKGIGAGGKMQAYRSGIMGDTESAKYYAQAQQDYLNKLGERSVADLQFQERLSGERNWIKDLVLDRDQTLSKERMSGYKRLADVQLGEYERRIKEAIAAERRKTTILGGLI